MSIVHYIDTSVAEPSQARMASLTNRIPQSFPVLVYGDVRSHNFIFHYAGNVEPFSGNANYSLRVTVGDASLGPSGGTYTLTCGTATPALDAFSDAQAVEYALNQLAAVIAGGGVTVNGQLPNFIVSWDAVGVQTAISVNATLLLPVTTATVTTIQAGDSTHAQISSLSFRQSPVAQQTNWTTSNSPSNGWVGNLATNGTNALSFVASQAEQDGLILQARTLLTAEVIETNTNYTVSYFQTPILLRIKPTA